MAPRTLSAAQVAALTAHTVHRVGPSLYVQIRSQGTRSWLFRYSRQGKNNWVGLGSARDVTLGKASEAAERMRVEVRDGVDPLSRKRAARADARTATANIPTFAQCAERTIETHRPGWKNEKHVAQWESTLRMYAAPVMGQLPVDQVGIDHILKVLKPIWSEKPETASRLRGRIEKVLGWAAAMGHRSGENPARWQGGDLSHLLPPLGKIQKIEHHKAVPYAEVPALVAELLKLGSTSARALIFTILTGVRTGTTIGAVWPEIDLDEKLWVIPAERMKVNREHRVPPADAVVELLNAVPRTGRYLFPGQRSGKGLSCGATIRMRQQRQSGSQCRSVRFSCSGVGSPLALYKALQNYSRPTSIGG
ncbi:MAG: integrase arm-type DNA-binding domain-containing protein [Devosia sp.]|nr:integrase arm-type DNA-binding domain-containing protein [Devosia sp.]